MTPYILTLTTAALAAIVNVQAGTIGPVEITEIGLTDAAFTVSSTLEILPGEFKRLPVAGDVLGDDLIHVTALDNGPDVYSYRGLALYTSTGLLFAVYGQADPISQKAPGAASYIVLDVAMSRGQSDAITFGNTDFLNPPASTEGQGVVELATQDEADAGTDDLRAITPATAKGAVLSWIGFAPLAAAAFTKAAILALLGFTPLDASAFTKANILALLGYVPFDSAGFTAAAIKTVLAYTPLDSAAFTRAAVEGFMDDPARFGSNANGFYEKRPNGVLEQWGYVAIPGGGSNTTGTITFPVPFTDADATEIVITGNITAKPNGSWGAATFLPSPVDKNGGAFIADTANQEQAFGSGIKASWRAIGRWA
jgi:hypothetical protein